ncbi:hypothetical protein GcM1_050004, partial [Golovinomyces cichoracearum]
NPTKTLLLFAASYALKERDDLASVRNSRSLEIRHLLVVGARAPGTADLDGGGFAVLAGFGGLPSTANVDGCLARAVLWM